MAKALNMEDIYINGIYCITEVEANIQPNGRRTRKGLFICPKCKEEFITYLQTISNGRTISCVDCLNKERGDAKRIHGLCEHRMFNIWQKMRDRCYNPNNDGWRLYGCRGVIICPEWKDDFKTFYDWSMANGYNDALTIDRINKPGGSINYEPSNCRWSTRATQSRNRGKSDGFTSVYMGVSYNTANKEWRAQVGYNYQHVFNKAFKTELKAAKARDEFIIENNLWEYNLNFPDGDNCKKY